MTDHEQIEQLAALLDGEHVPEAPSSLADLADLATAVRDHTSVAAPTTAFRRELRDELIAAAQRPPSLVERARTAWSRRTAGLRRSTRVAVAAMTASSMIGSAGIAVAAQQALPGEMLYVLKGLTEDIRVALAVDSAAEARLHLAYARERLHELQATVGQLDTDQVVALLAEMDAHSEAGAEALLGSLDRSALDTAEIRDFTADQRGDLVAMFTDLPLLARPMAQDSLELLRRIDGAADELSPAASAEAAAMLDHIPTSTTTDTTSRLRTTTEPDGGATADDAVLPEEQPADLTDDCDCIELRDASSTQGSTAEDDTDDTQGDAQASPDSSPERRTAEPTAVLTSPEADTDDGDDDDDAEDGEQGLRAPTAVEQLPGDELASSTREVAEVAGLDDDTDDTALTDAELATDSLARTTRDHTPE